ncbi:MAG: diaminopimelate epimerase [Planctomycetes bacterium]|nr:diaminopimelate epimerase [Planctomycetota bacterium]
MRYSLMSGAGNLFAVLDGFEEGLPADPGALARAVCAGAPQGGLDPRPDGLLIARPGRKGGACAMELYNADGSRPETCGNGLRCIAKLVVDRGHVRGTHFVIEADAGPCECEVVLGKGGVTSARISMGKPRSIEREVVLEVPGHARVVATLVDMGNPHCVLLVEDERTAPVATLGPQLERHAHFPRGTNVEFLALRAEGAFLRVWERGVGETAACGSGACAAAVAARELGRAQLPLALQLPGGRLEVSADPSGVLRLSGPVEELASGELPVPGMSAR